jgi:hypothetical protein
VTGDRVRLEPACSRKASMFVAMLLAAASHSYDIPKHCTISKPGGSGMGCLNARCERSVMRRSDRLDLGDAEADGKPDKTRRLVATAAAALLAFSAAPSFADHHVM